MVRTNKICQFRGKIELYLEQETRFRCIFRSPSTLYSSRRAEFASNSGTWAGENRRTRLFPAQLPVAQIVQILPSSITLNGFVNQALADYNNATKLRALYKHFLYLGHDCLSSHQSSYSEETVKQKNWCRKRKTPERSERNSAIHFRWRREFKYASCHSSKGNATRLSNSSTEATENVVAALDVNIQSNFASKQPRGIWRRLRYYVFSSLFASVYVLRLHFV